jgi:hypothetical protein
MKVLKNLSEISDHDLLLAVNNFFIAPNPADFRLNWEINREEFQGSRIKLKAKKTPYIIIFHFQGEPIFTSYNENTGRPIPIITEPGDDLLSKLGYNLPY